jgi:hypothetical protein
MPGTPRPTEVGHQLVVAAAADERVLGAETRETISKTVSV